MNFLQSLYLKGSLMWTATSYFPLQELKKHSAMPTVHLDVMKLKRDWERGLEASFTVLAPHYHRIAELVCVLVHNAVKLSLHHRRSSHYHIIFQKRAFTLFRSLLCKDIVRLNKL